MAAANKNRALAVALFVCALIAAFSFGHAIANGTGSFMALFVIEFVACVLWLVYLRGIEAQENSWCEARR